MRPTERTRPIMEASAAPHPVVRSFSRRELLLTSWNDRVKMSPADQVQFSIDRRDLETEFANKGESIVHAAGAEFEIMKAEKGKLPLFSGFRRGRGGRVVSKPA